MLLDRLTGGFDVLDKRLNSMVDYFSHRNLLGRSKAKKKKFEVRTSKK